MQLSRFARERYELRIDTETSSGSPIPASGWEASFDDGANWAATTVVTYASSWTDTEGNTQPAGDVSTWLIAGPDAAVGSAVAVINTASVRPLLRVTDSPEVVVRTGPEISVI